MRIVPTKRAWVIDDLYLFDAFHTHMGEQANAGNFQHWSKYNIFNKNVFEWMHVQCVFSELFWHQKR